MLRRREKPIANAAKRHDATAKQAADKQQVFHFSRIVHASANILDNTTASLLGDMI